MKTLVFVVLLVAMATSVFAFPTYTSNTHSYFAGNYGNSSYPCNVSDEIGNQLFDGDYGGYDWFYRHTVQSDADYLARYEQQNGFGYGWVAWYSDISNPTIIFDMGTPYEFQQVGVHGYQRLSGAFIVPQWISIAFSDDGVDFSGNIGESVVGYVPNDSVIWKTIIFQPTISRFIRIDFPTVHTYWLDEISINGMDGAQFPVPEPSGILALCGGVIWILSFRRRRK